MDGFWAATDRLSGIVSSSERRWRLLLQVHSWILEDLDAGSDITYLLKPPSSGEAAWRSDVPLLCANASGRVYALTPG